MTSLGEVARPAALGAARGGGGSAPGVSGYRSWAEEERKEKGQEIRPRTRGAPALLVSWGRSLSACPGCGAGRRSGASACGARGSRGGSGAGLGAPGVAGAARGPAGAAEGLRGISAAQGRPRGPSGGGSRGLPSLLGPGPNARPGGGGAVRVVPAIPAALVASLPPRRPLCQRGCFLLTAPRFAASAQMTHSILLRSPLPPHARTPKICRLCVWHKSFCALRSSVLLHDRIREHWLTVNFGELLFFFPFLCQICDGTRPVGAERCFPPQEGGVDAWGCPWVPLVPCKSPGTVPTLRFCCCESAAELCADLSPLCLFSAPISAAKQSCVPLWAVFGTFIMVVTGIMGTVRETGLKCITLQISSCQRPLFRSFYFSK